MLSRALVALAFLFAGAGCARKAVAPAKPPVILISVDTLRADHLPAYGYRAVETPAIDALAADSIRFENAYCNVPLTLPSHAAILTGLLPYENGVRDNAGFRLSPSRPTLAAMLRASSYAAGAAVSSFVLRGDRGLSAGFDSYDDAGEDNPTRERPGTESAAALAKWAGTVKDKPLFLFLHLYEPHAPYTPPEPFKSRYASSPYDGEIAAADAAVGSFVSFLKSAGLYDGAIVVFLSDHGEGLGDHGEAEHGVFLYREALRVPLLVKRPRSEGKGGVVAAPVSLTDVVPTVLSLLSIPVPAELHGVSLLSADPRADRRIYAETFYPRLDLGWSDLASLVDSRYHYIHAPRPELYDVVSDPGEKTDLAAGQPPAFRSMRAALEAMSRPFAIPEASSSEEVKKLAALGYISAAPPAADANSPLPDPKEKVEALRQLKALFELYYAGRWREAVPAARALVQTEPRILSGWSMLSDSLEHTGDLRGAIEALRSGLARAPAGTAAEQLTQTYDNLSILQEHAGDKAGRERTLKDAAARGIASEAMKRDLARLYIASGRSSDAAALLSASKPAEAESLETLGIALAGAGRTAQARQAFLDALAIEPKDARIAFNLGTLLLETGDAAGAREWLSKSLELDPRSAPGWSSLGLAQLSLGDSEGAAQSWRKALALDPNQYGSLYNLAVFEVKAGQLGEARRSLERFLAAAPRPKFAAQRNEARRLLAHIERAAPAGR